MSNSDFRKAKLPGARVYKSYGNEWIAEFGSVSVNAKTKKKALAKLSELVEKIVNASCMAGRLIVTDTHAVALIRQDDAGATSLFICDGKHGGYLCGKATDSVEFAAVEWAKSKGKIVVDERIY